MNESINQSVLSDKYLSPLVKRILIHVSILLKVRPTDECLFKETLAPNHFHTFASYKYRGRKSGNITNEFYLAIKKNGKLKHGANTAPIQKSVDFMVLPLKTGKP